MNGSEVKIGTCEGEVDIVYEMYGIAFGVPHCSLGCLLPSELRKITKINDQKCKEHGYGCCKMGFIETTKCS